MPPESQHDSYIRSLRAANLLAERGWVFLGNWIFEKSGRRYDLSAADISQADRIEREGLFLLT